LHQCSVYAFVCSDDANNRSYDSSSNYNNGNSNYDNNNNYDC